MRKYILLLVQLCGISLPIFLSGCMTAEAGLLQPLQNQPEDAVYDWMVDQPHAVAYSTAIRQVMQIAPFHAPVLISFTPDDWQEPMPALALFEVELFQNKWISTGNDYHHHLDWINNSLSLHTHQIDSQAQWTAAYGWITDPQATEVVIIWNDGIMQNVESENSTFLSFRTDNIKAYATRAIALDAKGKPLAEYTINLVAQR